MGSLLPQEDPLQVQQLWAYYIMTGVKKKVSHHTTATQQYMYYIIYAICHLMYTKLCHNEQ